MNNKNIKYIITVIIIVLLFIGLYYLLRYFTRDKYEESNYLRNYGVNEYIPTYISDEAMAKIYLNDYINNMLYNTDNSYYLLDEEYRNLRFGNYSNYLNYVRTINYNVKMTKFYKESKNGYIIFGIYDQNDKYFGFKTNGVMQYSVFLDEETVEIW